MDSCTLLLHFGTRAYLFSPDEGLCYVFDRNNCYVFLASVGVILQSDHFILQKPVCGDSLLQNKSCFAQYFLGLFKLLNK